MRLWTDASVARMTGKWRALVRKAKLHGVQVVVHAQIHLELCRHLRTARGVNYSQSYINDLLDQLGVSVEDAPLSRSAAERWAALLHARFPTDKEWAEAKKATIGGRLREGFADLPSRMPMTTDWWVALQVEEASDDRIAVEDMGREWDALRTRGRALTLTEAMAWLDELPVARPG